MSEETKGFVGMCIFLSLMIGFGFFQCFGPGSDEFPGQKAVGLFCILAFSGWLLLGMVGAILSRPRKRPSSYRKDPLSGLRKKVDL